MRYVCLAGLLSGVMIVGASGVSAEPAAAACAGLHLVPEELKIGDGALDRGFTGAVSLADVDGDGDLDLYATRGYDTSGRGSPRPPPDRSMLYLNDGRGNFSRAEDSVLSNGDNYASGSTFADLDGDGDLDVFVSTQLGQKDAFYRNLGGGRFERQELGDATSSPGSNFTGVWADVDGDGDLDIHAGGPTLSRPAPAAVFRNDAGRFTLVPGLPIDLGKSNPGALLWADLDGDGDQDLVAAASDIARLSKIDPAVNEFPMVFRNDGDWRFTRVTGQAFDASMSSASAALGDIDADGDLDLYLGAYVLGPPDATVGRDRLLRNDGRGRFAEVAGFAPAGHGEWATGAAFADFDMDGDLDLMTTAFNGGLEVQVNDGAGGFTRLTDPALVARKASHSAIAVGDIDGDGDPDAVVGNWGDLPGGQYSLVLRNQSVRCGDWAEFMLSSRAGAPNPPGARVTLVTRGRGGERRHLREASSQSGFRSQSASAFLFALPRGERIVRVEVRWPDGGTQVLRDVKRNARTAVRQG